MLEKNRKLLRLGALGRAPGDGGQSPAEFGKFVRLEIETWGEVVKASGAKVEN